MVQTDYGGSKSTNPKDIEAEVKAAFDATIAKTKQKHSDKSIAPVSVETVEQSTRHTNVSQSTTQVTKPQLPQLVPASEQEQSKRTLSNRGIKQTTMNFGSTNPAPILRDHFLRIPALQKVEPVAQTFADVRKLASNSGNNDGQGGRSGTFGDGYEAAKEQLRQEAEQEFLYNTTDWGQTMIRNFAVNPDAPYMAGLVNYLQLLLQSPKGLEYTRYTAAEQEAEKAQRIEEIKEWANENGYSPLLSALYGEDTNGILNLPSGISLVTAPFQGADYLLDALETAYVGAPLPSSTPDITETTQALREGVSQNMTETGQFFYNATMSTADSLIAGWLGGGSTGGGIILGMGAASNTAHDIINRGGTAEDALIGGAVSGILEGVFEKASLGQLKAMRTLPADSAKAVLGNIAKSVVTNASEELATELANTIFDTIFMDELSTYALTVQGYLSQGKSETDARWLANTDLLKRLSESAAAGALTGVLFGTGASADSYYRSQLAAQGEAKLRTMEMPTPRELEAMNASEAEARGAMVLLNIEQFDNVADNGYSVRDVRLDGGIRSNTKIYTPVEYKGTVKVNGEVRDVSRRVYQRSDIDFDYVDDTTGISNLERMRAGKPPIGSDGHPIQLHHVLQIEKGPMVEIREVTHQEYYSQLHSLIKDGYSFRNDPTLHKQYNNFRYNYWKWRAERILGGD